MANDICNSRCEMCLIWKQKLDAEISPEQLEQVLAEPLFRGVLDIGVTGGEPTLRRDLPELFRVIARKTPRIRSASIITNAIREQEVESRVRECFEICRGAGIYFSVMVSLDGLGETHDAVRGRKGNFETALRLIERFRELGIPTSFGCTITTTNAAAADDLLDYAIEHGLYGRFRVAEFIDRLYNAPQGEFIRNFTPEIRNHLGLLFFRLEHEFETHSTFRKTYRSIRGMLAEGKPRSTGCPYHHSSVILTSRGELLYCSPKSPNLGSILVPGSASQAYFSNLGKRAEIRRSHCDDCIHDYHVPETFLEKAAFFRKHARIRRTYDLPRLVTSAERFNERSSTGRPDEVSARPGTVLIVGWYGTETVGDKAILASIVAQLRGRAVPPARIVVSSLYPFITEWTKQELKLPELDVVETYSAEFEQTCGTADEVVVGGGPLMDLQALDHILYAALQARRRNAIVRVEGCGLGPLRDPRYVPVVRQILRLADIVRLRDRRSVDRCRDEFGVEAAQIPDPATGYVESLRDSLAHPLAGAHDPGSPPGIACFLREWEPSYADQLSPADFQRKKEALENEFETMLAWFAGEEGLLCSLLPMHSFQIGGDDRVLNRRLRRRLAERGDVPASRIDVAALPVSPVEIVRAMSRARLNICMRFHSVLFAETLGVPYVAIDYTQGGKIRAFLEERNQLHRLISIDEFIAGKWRDLVKAMDPATPRVLCEP